MMKYTRLYTGQDNHSHFEEVDVRNKQPVDNALIGEAYYLFDPKEVMMGHINQQVIDWHHPPGRVFVIYLEGYIEMEVSSGEMRRFGPGDTCLIEDSVGAGHLTRITESEGLRYIMISLAES